MEFDTQNIKKIFPMPKVKCMKSSKPSSIHMTTCFATKASTPRTTVVRSYSIVLSLIFLPLPLARSPLHPRGTFLFRMCCKRERLSCQLPWISLLLSLWLRMWPWGNSWKISWRLRFPFQPTTTLKNSLPKFVYHSFVFPFIFLLLNILISIFLMFCCAGWS